MKVCRMIEHLRGGNMNLYESNTGQYILYKDYSNSAIGASLYQSSADPTNLASIIRNAFIFFLDQPLIDEQLFDLELDTKLKVWDTPLNDEELTALYAEAAEEDEELVQLGLVHYAEVLKQEEEIE